VAGAAERARDLWGGDPDEGYSLLRFYTRSTDGHGHGTQTNVRIPPDIYERMSALVATRRFPHYRTVHDVIRDAIVHRLAWLGDQDETEGDLSDQLRTLVAGVALQQYIADYDSELSTFDSMRSQVNRTVMRAHATKDFSHLRLFLGHMRKRVADFRPELSGQLLELIDRELGRIPDTGAAPVEPVTPSGD
jgi:hypothetical protein